VNNSTNKKNSRACHNKKSGEAFTNIYRFTANRRLHRGKGLFYNSWVKLIFSDHKNLQVNRFYYIMEKFIWTYI